MEHVADGMTYCRTRNCMSSKEITSRPTVGRGTRSHTPTGDRARTRPALRHGVRHHAQDLEHEIGPIEGSVARGIERGSRLRLGTGW